MKNFLILAIASLTFAACADSGTPTDPTSPSPMSKRTQVQDDVTGYYLYNPCCDSWIELSGSIHRNFEFTWNEDGSYTSKYHANWQGVGGTDQNGIKFRAVGSVSDKSSWSPTEGGGFRIVDRTRFQATGADGKGCTFVIRVTIDVSVDEYGNVTVKKAEFLIECV